MKKSLLPMNRNFPFPPIMMLTVWDFYIFQEIEMLEPVVFHKTGFFKNLFL